MGKDIFILAIWIISALQFNCDAVLFDDVPKLLVHDGNLIFESATDKNISISLKGRSRLNINELDVVEIIGRSSKRAGAASSSGDGSESGYEVQLSTLRSALFGESGLEQRIVYLENATRIGRTRFRFRNMQQRLRRLETKIERLMEKAREDDCKSNPCQNGGTCIDLYDSYMCKCPPNWEGKTCGEDVNECAEFVGTVQGCQNGAECVNSLGSYSCICKPGWVGVHCTQRHSDCLRSSTKELCDHGTCVTTLSTTGYTCVCEQGWKTNGLTPACSVDINECEESKPACASQCINLPGSFTCGPCPAGFTGNGFVCRDLNECEVNNGGCSINPRVTCINSYGSFHCGDCPIGWTGDGRQCTRAEGGACSRNICHPSATCREFSNTIICSCPPGMTGDGVGLNGCVMASIDPCANRCKNGGTCIANGTSYTCVCPPGLPPPNCEEPFDPCRSNPCQNGGTCVIQGNGRRFQCLCPSSYRGRRCQLVQTRCGGVLTSSNGTLKYPLTSNYENNVRCAWLIRTNVTKVLEVKFTKFELESSAGCFFDWLQIHDGGGSASQIIGRFCGSELPKGGRIVSTHNMLYLWFRSDNSTSHNGFELTWKSIEPECGGTIETSTYGIISSPGSPGNYPPNRDCEWRLIAPLSKRLQLTFFVMALEAHDDCDFDYLSIYDGSSSNSELLQKYCNTSHPPPLLTSSHEATLHFHSDSHGTDAGFQIHYAVVAGFPGCGGVFTASKGSFKSPTDNGKYASHLNCEYLIKLPLGTRIKLHFTEFGIEQSVSCLYDYLEIYDGETEQSPKVNRYCGQNTPPDYLSESNALLLKFVTDFDDADKGFTVEYDTVCGGNFKDPEGVLTSPMYPNTYAHNRMCLYEILAPLGKIVVLSFQDFDLEGHRSGNDDQFLCNYDSLEIFEGANTESSYKFCGNKVPTKIVSKSNILNLKLVTDESLGGRGFKANYSFIDVGCGGVLKEQHMLIKPPLGSETGEGVYQHDANCEWVIWAPVGYLIHLSFISFRLEHTSDCAYDFVEIYDNSTQPGTKIGRYCGSDKPPAITSGSNVLTIKFQSDSSDSGEGFVATYYFLDGKKVCGGNYYSASGVLKSPDYPSEYLPEKNCIWTITVPTGNQIELKVKKFELEQESRCTHDYLEIRNGNSETSPLIGKFCGLDIPKRIPSFSNHLYVKFVSDYSGTAAGFEIEWDGTLTGCGGHIKTYRGSITSPNYPGSYNDNAQCDWRITTSKGSTIDIIIPELILETSSTCFYDYLEIYDGFGVLNHMIGRYCNAFNDIIHVKTTQNEALIRFVTDNSNSNKGFLLSYSTNCNNELNDLQGVIESPNFPEFYPDGLECKWTIKGRKSSKIVVHFSHLELETLPRTSDDADSCPYDYIQILEKNGKRFNPLKKFCSLTKDAFESSAEAIQITFTTDVSGSASGFRLEYQIKGCGGMLNKPTGEFTSPGYPNNYPHNAYCEWIIHAQFGYLIELNITDLQVESIDVCNYDGVLVSNGRNAEQKIAVYCGENVNLTSIRSNGNDLFVQFFSDASSNGRGFRAVYKQVAAKCGGTFLTNTGSIHSPNYPYNYEPTMECQWLIQVEDTNSITFGFSEFDLEQSPSCVHDSVKIYDGSEINPDNLLLKHCGSDLPNITNNSTRTNSMLVIFKTDGDTQSKGFILDYHMNCGKRIYANGTGKLKMIPSMKSEECTWTIITEPGQHITFTTTHFERSVSVSLQEASESPCMGSGLEFYDGDSTKSPLKEKFCEKYPHSMISRGNALTIRLDIPIISGFEGFYSVYENACGGKLTSLNGKFSSPLYPDSYPINVECIWTIEATPGNRLELAIDEIDMEKSDNCNEDYLEIRDGGPLGNVMGIFCGNEVPSTMIGQSLLWIKFRSDDDNVGKGFLAQYSHAHEIEIDGTNGTITSPRYPNFITDFSPYAWRITVATGNVIQATFPDGRGEEINGFYNQRFEVYNGYDDTAVPLDLPRDALSFISSTSSIYIKTILPLFKMNWNMVSKADVAANITKNSECKEVISVGTSPYVLNSPGYPNGYKEALDCEWIFKTEANVLHTLIHIMAIDIDDAFGCNADYMQVSTSKDMIEWKELLKACKLDNNRFNYYEGDPYLKVVFHTDYYGNRTGFSAIVAGKCGAELTSASGAIDTTMFIDTGPTFDCVWKIRVQRGRKIKMKFEEISLPKNPQGTCPSYIMIKNGEDDESPILGTGKYCGTEIPDIPNSSSNIVFIKYKNSYPSGSWRLTYETVMNECDHSISLDYTSNSTTITTPNFPNIPTPHSLCVWVVVAPLGEHIQIHFNSFDLTKNPNCANEYVEIRDGATQLSNQIDIFCTQPNTIDSTSNAMRIAYFTDLIDPKTGFNATVSIGKCGGTYHQRDGIITSKNYPHLGGYPSNSVCEYRIIFPVGVIVNITFNDIHLPSGDCKVEDHLEISYVTLGSVKANDSLEYNLCGSYTLPYLVINSNEVILKFYSYKPNTIYRGFKLSYAYISQGCGGFINSDKGVITTPGYPNGWANTIVCIWRITVPKGRKVKLELLDFDVPIGRRENVTGSLFAPVRRRSTRIGFFNDHRYLSSIGYYYNNPPSIIYSSDNLMLVTCWFSPATGYRGIKMSYSSDEPTICEGSLESNFGSLSLPVTNSSLYCLYEVPMLNGRETFAMKFTNVKVTRQLLRLPCEFRPPIAVLDGTKLIMRICDNSSETILRSPYLNTKLQLVQMAQSKISSFNMTFRRHQCGGVISWENPYHITSPLVSNTSDSYGSLDCAWLLEVSPNNPFPFKISGAVKMKLGCDKEYISISVGPNGPHIARICGDMSVSNISSLNQATIQYHSDKYDPSSIINITIDDVDECGDHVVSAPYTARLTNGYKSNVECIWTVKARPGYHLQASFIERFYIEESFNCSKDVLEIYDMTDGNWVQVARVCGRNKPPDFISTENMLRLKFKSDDSKEGDGFSIQFENKCGGVYHVGSEPKFITSPNYPASYQSNLTCNYTLIAPDADNTILVRFTDFKLESIGKCRYDNVTVYSYNFYSHIYEELGAYCLEGSLTELRYKNRMVIMFKTDTNGQNRGFKFEYSLDKCGEVVTENKLISSPKLSAERKYPSNVHCMWNITAPRGKEIQIKFEDFDTELSSRCYYDYVQIFKGNKELDTNKVATLCGNLTGKLPTVNIDNSHAIVHFRTDPSNAGRGFSAWILFKDQCDQTINLDMTNPSYVFDKFYGSSYTVNMDCAYLFSAPDGYHVRVDFEEFHVAPCSGNLTEPCSCDYLEFRDGAGPFSELINRFCGHILPPSVYSTRSKLYTRFVSDSLTTSNGVKATFSIVASRCGPRRHELEDTTGITLQTPGETYPPNLKCLWEITSSKYQLHIHFENFDLQGPDASGLCIYDVLSIYTDSSAWTYDNGLDHDVVINGVENGVVTSFPESMSRNPEGRLQYCGNHTPEDYFSNSNTVYVHFKSDGEIEKTGVKFKVIPTEGCVKNYTGTQGRILLRSYLDCEFYILAPENHTISIYFHAFYVLDDNCDSQSFTILDGRTGKELTKKCGQLEPSSSFFSSTNHLKIKVKNTGMFANYDATFIASSAGIGCGGSLRNYGGLFTSPFYPLNARNDSDCRWEIQVPNNMKVAVVFDVFDLGAKTTCRSDYVQIIEYEQNGEEIARQYCGEGITLQTPGETYPPNLKCLWEITSSKYQLHIHFENFDLQGPDASGLCIYDVLSIYTDSSAWTYDNGLDHDVVINGVENGVVTSFPESMSRNPEGRLQYCGNHTPEDYFSNSNTVYVHFKSDGEIEKTGVKFKVIPTEGCVKNYTGTQGRILLRSYLDCEFYILAPENHTISIYFHAFYVLDDNCDSQSFTILDGRTGKELTKKCGQLEPSSSFFSSTNHLKIKVKNTGMFANYDATFIASSAGIGCGGSLRNYGGLFTSPFYPLNARNDSDCRWEIQVPNNMKVAVVFDVFDLGAKTTCRSDYVQIIEYEQNGEEIARQYCGEDKPAAYRGRRNRLAIRYRKTVNFDGTGWVIRFGAINDDTKIFNFD